MFKKIISIIFILSLLCTPVHAQMKSFYHNIFLGKNDKANPRLLKDNESPSNKNYTLSETGAIEERTFFGQYNTSAGALGNNAITGIFKLYQSDGDKFFISTAGSNIAKGSAGVWSDITNAGISSTTAYWYSATLNDSLKLANKDNILQDWDGTSSTTVSLTNGIAGPSENLQFIVTHKNRMWGVGTDNPNRVYYSSLNNSHDWTATGGTFDIFVNDGDTITGLKVMGDILYVFKNFNIYAVLGRTPNEFSVQRTNSDVGCVAPNSIQQTDFGIIFLARTGVFIFNGSNSTKISDKIENTIRAINTARIQNSSSIYDKDNHYWLSYTSQTGTNNDSIVVYNTLLKEWYSYDGLNFNVFFKADGGNDKGELYGGSSLNDGIVWQLQTETGSESIIHDTQTQFQTGVTDNLIITDTPELMTDDLRRRPGTKLMLHFDGADGDTSTEDVSTLDHTIQFFGDAQLDASQVKYGTTSLELEEGGGSRLVVADDTGTDWDVIENTTDSWTIHFWVRMETFGGIDYYLTQREDQNERWIIQHSEVDNGMRFVAENSGVPVINTGYAGKITDSSWHHIALVKKGNVYAMYKDGQQINHTANNTTDTYTGPLHIGSSGAGTNYLDGWMDELVIINSNIFNANPLAGLTDRITVPTRVYSSYGTLNSDTIEINATGQASFGTMDWTETDGFTETTVKFQTRTNTTDATVFRDYFGVWEDWVSESTSEFATLNTIQGILSEVPASLFVVANTPTTTPRIQTLYFEDEAVVSPNCIELFTGVPDACAGRYVEFLSSSTDLSSMEYLGGWWLSRITGDVIAIGLYDSDYGDWDSLSYTTLNTVTVTDTWAKFHIDLSKYTSSELDAVTAMRIMYVGDNKGAVSSGSIWFDNFFGYNYLDSGDINTSTPDNFVQYRAIESTSNEGKTPIFTQWKLIYTPTLTATEGTVDYEYKTNITLFEDNGRLNKQFKDYRIWMESDDQVVQTVEWETDEGEDSGEFSFPVVTTGRTVRYTKPFPSSTNGRSMQRIFKRDDATSSSVKIRSEEILYLEEGHN